MNEHRDGHREVHCCGHVVGEEERLTQLIGHEFEEGRVEEVDAQGQLTAEN